jgi:ribosomal protein S18 acetylase RimI-like enzyme
MLYIRHAKIDDLPAIVRMLADDFLGQQRERLDDPLPEGYIKAFREIENYSNNELIVAGLTDASGTLAVQSVVGTMQLIFTPSLSYQGGRRCTVESVRVEEKFRGRGIGREMMLWAIERAREKGCVSMQLTTHGERKDAHRFYENLGFTASHVGMKLKL